ncbi:MAG: DUF6020 family protein [Lachnospiraceae bacterium]|nr:DUF6020 family protein [Lachnospiraceae bacterium]
MKKSGVNIDIRPSLGEMIYAFAFALMTVFSRHTVYSDDVASSILTTYVRSFTITDVPAFLLTAIIIYICLKLVKYVLGLTQGKMISTEGPSDHTVTKGILCFFSVFFIIMICYIPYIMSYWPGGIYNDTSDSIDIALGRSAWSNQNTVLYALFWKAVFAIGSIAGQGDYGGLKLMTVLQPMAIAVTAATFITWLRGRGVRKWMTVLLTAIVALCPVFPYYGVSLWKETWFGIALFVYTWVWYVISESFCGDLSADTVADESTQRHRASFVPVSMRLTLVYIFSTLWIIFSRNNGLYVVLFTMTVGSIVLYGHMKRSGDIELTRLKCLTLVNITAIVLSLVIQHPIYNAAGIKESAPVEKFGIPLQQVAYIISSNAVASYDAEIDAEMAGSDQSENHTFDDLTELGLTEAQAEVMKSILPAQSWILAYNPVVVDSIKYNDYFNREYFDEHTGDFIKAYTGIVLNNPGLAIKGYLVSTMGFWDAYKSSSSAYICTEHTVQAEYFMSDYFNLKTGMTLSDIVGPRWYISGGALVWIMLGLFVVSISISKEKKCNADRKGAGIHPDERSASIKAASVLPFLPGIGLWLTLMIATPLSFSFRYVFGLLLCIPIFLCTIVNIKYCDIQRK